MENFLGTLKFEFFYLKRLNNLDEFESCKEDYIHCRNHSLIRLKLSGLSCGEYQTQTRRAEKAPNFSGASEIRGHHCP